MEPYLGQIQLFPYNFVPTAWAACEGQLLPIAQNTALFSLLGTTYGGDGHTTFALPDLRGKEPIPYLMYCIALTGIYPSRN
jgi:microcystin-dependent protein